MMVQDIQTLPEYFLAVIRLFVLFRVFNIVLYKIIGKKTGYNRSVDKRKNIIMDWFFSMIYYAILMTTKSIASALISAFLGSEIIAAIGERIYKLEKKDSK